LQYNGRSGNYQGWILLANSMDITLHTSVLPAFFLGVHTTMPELPVLTRNTMVIRAYFLDLCTIIFAAT
jgi:hypothetical protein